MELRESVFNDLKYAQEHLACDCYMSKEDSVWGNITAEPGEYVIREPLKRNVLVFIMSGAMDISTAGTVCMKVGGGNMFLLSAGDHFHGRAVEKTSLVYCAFNNDLALCNRFSIEQLKDYRHTSSKGASQGDFILPIHRFVFNELCLIKDIMETGLACSHFQHLKKDMIFIELRGFYEKEELARLFAPILGNTDDFKDRVLHTYPHVKTAKELTDMMNMSQTAFNRKFRDVFGVSVRQWLISKKKEKLIRDILMSDMTMAELSEKYEFSDNYISTFCRKHFGMPPTELRMLYKR